MNNAVREHRNRLLLANRNHRFVPHLLAAGQQLQIFTEVRPLIAAMVADIRKAQQRVWLESYTFAADAAGRAIAEALQERARAGVNVRVMYDAFGSYATPAAFFDHLRYAGVRVHAFHSLGEALGRFSPLQILNRRNHRKLLIVDDRVAYFGGMNVVDQSAATTVEQARARDLPVSSGWRDVHIRLAGPLQGQIVEMLDRLWQQVHRRAAHRPPSWRLQEMLHSRSETIHFFESDPSFRRRRAQRIFVPLIRQARESITLSMAYFVPVGRVLRELLRARRRGVAVQVIVPGQNDVPLVQWAAQHVYAKLLRRGVRIFERQDYMLHGKVMVVDHEWALAGSCNLDPRSLHLNLEFLAVMHSLPVTAAVERICAHEIRHSREVRLEDCHRRRWWQRLRDRLAWALRWWL